jgi:hypothetical protein
MNKLRNGRLKGEDAKSFIDDRFLALAIATYLNRSVCVDATKIATVDNEWQ